MKVHVLTRRATYGHNGKVEIMRFFARHDRGWLDYYGDFFKAEAHLEAPGNAVQPLATGGSTLNWSGKTLGVDSSSDLWARGQLIGGDAAVSVFFTTQESNALATVRLTNLKGSHTHGGSPLQPGTYPNLTWASIPVNNGAFSTTNTVTNGSIIAGAKVSGTFRGSTAGTVGGTFEVPGTMVGGFVATK